MKVITLIPIAGTEIKESEKRLQHILTINQINKDAVVRNKNNQKKEHYHLIVPKDKTLELEVWNGKVKTHITDSKFIANMRATHEQMGFDEMITCNTEETFPLQ